MTTEKKPQKDLNISTKGVGLLFLHLWITFGYYKWLCNPCFFLFSPSTGKQFMKTTLYHWLFTDNASLYYSWSPMISKVSPISAVLNFLSLSLKHLGSYANFSYDKDWYLNLSLKWISDTMHGIVSSTVTCMCNRISTVSKLYLVQDLCTLEVLMPCSVKKLKFLLRFRRMFAKSFGARRLVRIPCRKFQLNVMYSKLSYNSS